MKKESQNKQKLTHLHNILREIGIDLQEIRKQFKIPSSGFNSSSDDAEVVNTFFELAVWLDNTLKSNVKLYGSHNFSGVLFHWILFDEIDYEHVYNTHINNFDTFLFVEDLHTLKQNDVFIKLDPYASKEELFDFIENNWEKIQELQKHQKEQQGLPPNRDKISSSQYPIRDELIKKTFKAIAKDNTEALEKLRNTIGNEKGFLPETMSNRDLTVRYMHLFGYKEVTDSLVKKITPSTNRENFYVINPPIS